MVNNMKKVVFFTGAGVSAESGINTFRYGDSMWENHNVDEVAHIDAWSWNKENMLKFYNQLRSKLSTVEPNAAHLAIAKMQNEGFDVYVITQNVDNLHERAGTKDVTHLHGELTKSRSSLNPKLIYDCIGDINIGDVCERGSQLRPMVTWFGEGLDPVLLNEASNLARNADYFIIVGSSMAVQPAASIPFLTKEDTPIFYVDPRSMDFEIPRSRRPSFMHVMANATTGIPKVIDRIKMIENSKIL